MVFELMVRGITLKGSVGADEVIVVCLRLEGELDDRGREESVDSGGIDIIAQV